MIKNDILYILQNVDFFAIVPVGRSEHSFACLRLSEHALFAGFLLVMTTLLQKFVFLHILSKSLIE